jgi:hypothetical protein
MLKIEKILFFIFTLFIVYLVNKQCLVENLINYNSFNVCTDDPSWYTLGENDVKYYCRDIGTSASCYDMDPLQQEGWEKCLNTCGNCANTQVSIAPMDNLAIQSGGSGEDFDRYNIDDSRKWLGLDVGDENNIDVRESLTKDETDDIVDIYDRLNIVEDMYDMLLSSVSSCIDCSQYNETECPDNICTIEGGDCIIRESNNTGSFRSCNGSELSCDYTITQVNNDDDNDDTTEEVDGTSVTHTYVKHYCDEHGVCSILFPTYDINCDSIPVPTNTTGDYPTITYEPVPVLPRKCLSSTYYTDNIVEDNTINVTPESPEGHICMNTIDSIEPRDIILSGTSNNINIEDGEIWETDQGINITTKTGMNEATCEAVTDIKVRVNRYTDGNDSNLTLIDIDNDQELNTTEITELVTNCQLSREGGDGTTINRCYKLNETQVENNDDMVNCATYCNSVTPLTKYITVNNNECRCYSLEPDYGDNVISPNSSECPDEHPIPFRDEGEVVSVQRMRMANINPNDQIRNMCKNYFLLETSLDGESPDDTENSISGMSDRVSLYDVCPSQCKAVGCE